MTERCRSSHISSFRNIRSNRCSSPSPKAFLVSTSATAASLSSCKQDGGSVRAQVKNGDGSTADLAAQYLVGCDGGSSTVRRQLGIKLQGEANLMQFRQALYRCDDLFDRIPIGKGRHYHVADAHSTFLIVQDSTRHFTLHAVVDSDADMQTMFEQTVAMPVKYEMLSVGQWRQNLL